ncbi:iron-containing alcohol dehydrogenase [Amphibiibacter pelophylacis]|uniref:Iron-containing alcohol dehydrogenase n=1 Tax=Amphibiibacter pelophylacis TaxID=1799477 RepID=A0ACC6P552_9BURK
MTLSGNWNYPTAIRFGAGRLAELPALCAQAGLKRPLVVTDPGLAASPLMARVTAALGDTPHGVFSDMRPNPVGRDVDAGVHALRAGGHDGVIAFGGGSALDVGKAIALMSGQDRPMWDLEDVGDNWLRVKESGVAPSLAIPTTAGTGSEVGRASLIIDEASQRKVILFHPLMLPKLVLADPELTLGLPPHITAATGIDAFVHNFEAYCSPFYHPMAQGVALEGMRLIHEFLPQAVRQGSDITARSQMLAASMMGATAFQKGLGGVHALSHAVGAMFNVHHGLANAVLLPYVMWRNRSAIADRLVPVARYLGLPQPSFEALLDWVLALRRDLGIAHSLGELGLDDAQAAAVAAKAKQDPSDGGNPLTLTVADYRQLYLDALAGRVGYGD